MRKKGILIFVTTASLLSGCSIQKKVTDDDKARVGIVQSQVGESLPYLPIIADRNDIEKQVISCLKKKHSTGLLRIEFVYKKDSQTLSKDIVSELYKKYAIIDLATVI